RRSQGSGQSPGQGPQAPLRLSVRIPPVMDASVSRRPPTTTLPRRADFLRVAATRKRCATPGLILQVAPLPDALRAASLPLRVGYTASRKVGKAVARNRAKRRLREAVRKIMPVYARDGLDYV